MTGLFPPDAVVRRVDQEPVLLLGGGRALLMQLAHPLVAAGVAEHSDFETDPLRRLLRTLDASYTIVYGTQEEAESVAATIRAVHDRVQGPGYWANDPSLLLWVHATLVDTALRVHARFLQPLGDDEAERYYQESMQVAELLGVRRDVQPPDLSSFRDYMRTMVGSLEVSPTARRLARAVLHARLPVVLGPSLALVRQVTIGLLPAPLRVQYGLDWDRSRDAALQLTAAGSRQVLSRLPASVRRVPALVRT